MEEDKIIQEKDQEIERLKTALRDISDYNFNSFNDSRENLLEALYAIQGIADCALAL